MDPFAHRRVRRWSVQRRPWEAAHSAPMRSHRNGQVSVSNSWSLGGSFRKAVVQVSDGSAGRRASSPCFMTPCGSDARAGRASHRTQAPGTRVSEWPEACGRPSVVEEEPDEDDMDGVQESHADLEGSPDRTSQDENKVLDKLTSTFWESGSLREGVGVGEASKLAMPTVVRAAFREFAVTFVFELLCTSLAAAAVCVAGQHWGRAASALSDFLVRVGFSYMETGGIASPVFAGAMVASGHLRASHSVLLVSVEVCGVLLGRGLLLVVLPAPLAINILPSALVRDVGSGIAPQAWATARSRLLLVPIGICPTLYDLEDQTLRESDGWTYDLEQTSETPFALGLAEVVWQLLAAFLFCGFVFNVGACFGRHARIAMAGVGTMFTYYAGLQNPAWAAVRGLLACSFVGVWHTSAGALIGGIIAGVVDTCMKHLYRQRKSSDKFSDDDDDNDVPACSDDEDIEVWQT